jgi:transcriptional/translational regulatory protein YebC/TACO1
MVPQSTIEINDEHVAGRIVSLMEAFDDHDDVQNAYANFDIPDEIMNKIS